MKIHFLGAADGVTCSRHLEESAGARILLDCGPFQGWKLHREHNWALPAPLREVDAVVLSHAPQQTFFVHGEPDAADTLRADIQTQLGWRVRVPGYGECAKV